MYIHAVLELQNDRVPVRVKVSVSFTVRVKVGVRVRLSSDTRNSYWSSDTRNSNRSDYWAHAT